MLALSRDTMEEDNAMLQPSTSAEGTTAFPLCNLPADLQCKVLQCVMRQVDQKQRLTSCALVCRAWRTAATAATTSINVPRLTKNRASSLSKWLNGTGIHQCTGVAGQLVTVNAHGQFWLYPRHLALQIPFQALQQLQALQLGWIDIRGYNPTSSSAPNINSISVLTSLTCLELDRVTISMEDGLQFLSHLTHLKRLKLCYCEPEEPATIDSIDTTLHQLRQLTHLSLEFIYKGANELEDDEQYGLTALHCLTGLKELSLNSLVMAKVGMIMLPRSLSSVVLDDVRVVKVVVNKPEYDISAIVPDLVNAPWSFGLHRLSNMRRLVIEHMYIDGFAVVLGVIPELAQHLVQLEHLSLRYSSCHDDSAVNNTPKLLAGLQHLTNLQHLDMCETLRTTAEPVALYSTITSSTKLSTLDLKGCKLPHGIIGSLFPQGRQMPALHALLIGSEGSYPVAGDLGEASTMDASLNGVEQLVACCPNLRELCLGKVLGRGEQLTALGSLQQLHTLEPVGAAINDNVMVAALPDLTRLTKLRIVSSPGFTTQGLIKLTQLKQLRMLEVNECRVCAGLDKDARWLTSKGDPTDVWKQLEQVCLKYDISRDLMLASELKDAKLQ